MAFGNGTHNGADGEAVEIVINENEHAEQHGQQLSGTAGLNGFLSPAAECFAAAALVHQIDHYAKHYQEYYNAHVIAVRQNGYDTVVSANQFYYGVPGVELSVKQCAYQATQEQRRINFLADKGQHYGYDRRKQGPESSCEGSFGLNGFAVYNEFRQRSALEAEHHKQHYEYGTSNKIGYFCTFFVH